MEIKSNVRQRRMDRMKQLTESRPAAVPVPDKLSRRDVPQPRLQPPRAETLPIYPNQSTPAAYDSRWEDPEFAWNQRDRFRSERSGGWKRLEGTASGVSTSSSASLYGGRGWLTAPSKRQIAIKLGIAAALFAVAYGMFQSEHPLALKGRHWVTASLTQDYEFAKAAAWYESKFSGLPAVLPASWRRADPETQKASTVNARQMYAPVVGTIVSPYTPAEPRIWIETAADAEVKALDAGRVSLITTGTDGLRQVVVQHANGLETTYGNLKETSLGRYDWVKGGETIGRAAAAATGPSSSASASAGSGTSKTGKLLFGLKKDDQWIDPTDVVVFD
ncbi:M23 family metallopeptidase [Paenibacillus koleovorans]|uniref:M23 family metallopeptidase n=1 Tax=Paenibacillus koleovorans TaxID=121608 RepID=UPI0013E3CA9E|nr:M23 family metallopeptidase [Paenibacillus koleovorans]